MTISLPHELESSLRAEVLRGHFATPEDAITEIVRDYFRRKAAGYVNSPGISEANGDLGSIEAMKDAADELDEAMDYSMKWREQPWRVPTSE